MDEGDEAWAKVIRENSESTAAILLDVQRRTAMLNLTQTTRMLASTRKMLLGSRIFSGVSVLATIFMWLALGSLIFGGGSWGTIVAGAFQSLAWSFITWINFKSIRLQRESVTLYEETLEKNEADVAALGPDSGL